MIIRRVDALSVGKVLGCLYFLIGLIAGGLVSLFALLGAAAAGPRRRRLRQCGRARDRQHTEGCQANLSNHATSLSRFGRPVASQIISSKPKRRHSGICES